MTETIGAKIYELMSPIVPTYYSEAETDTYPFAVYSQELTFVHTKDGIAGIKSDLVIDVIGKDFDVLDTKCAQILSAIDGLNDGTDYTARRKSFRKDCSEGVWDFSINYRIIQNN